MGSIARGALGFLLASVLGVTPAAASMCAALCAGPQSNHHGSGDGLRATGGHAALHGDHGAGHHHERTRTLPSSAASAVPAADAAVTGKVPFCCDAVGMTARTFRNIRPVHGAPLLPAASLPASPLTGTTIGDSVGALRRGPPGAVVPLLPTALRTTILRI